MTTCAKPGKQRTRESEQANLNRLSRGERATLLAVRTSGTQKHETHTCTQPMPGIKSRQPGTTNKHNCSARAGLRGLLQTHTRACGNRTGQNSLVLSARLGSVPPPHGHTGCTKAHTLLGSHAPPRPFVHTHSSSCSLAAQVYTTRVRAFLAGARACAAPP